MFGGATIPHGKCLKEKKNEIEIIKKKRKGIFNIENKFDTKAKQTVLG